MEHQITKVKLSGLSCDACKKVIEKRLSKISDVMLVSVSLEDSTAEVAAMRNISVDEIKEALKDTEYSVIGLAAGKEKL